MGAEIFLIVGVVIIITCLCFILFECECCEGETPPMSENENIEL